MFAKQIYRIDCQDETKYPYSKMAREKDCQASIAQDLYDKADKLRDKKDIPWLVIMENGLRRFVDENKGVPFSPGVSKIRPLHAEVGEYMRKKRSARFLTRIREDIWEEANKIREKRNYTWVYIIESILEQFVSEK